MIKQLLQKTSSQRSGLVILLFILLVSVSAITRMVLLVRSMSQMDVTLLNVAGIFGIGLFYDLVNGLYFSIPLILYLWFIPERVFVKQWHRFITYSLFFVFTFMLLFNAVAEWFFWDEFSTRFNFIAVDYLVYTEEVVGNIWESYPILWIVVFILVSTSGIVFISRRHIQLSMRQPMPFKQRTKFVAVYAAITLLSFYLVSTNGHRFSGNAYVNELSGNGLYELFAAYRNNELNFDQFYSRLSEDRAFNLVNQVVKTPESEFVYNEQPGVERRISNNGPEKKLNVILISVESLSADFLGTFGNKDSITPNLDSLAKQSLLFTNLYATGTRTVRGLEALSLSVPPTPGQSIVRRPGNEHLFSLGDVFDQKGYDTKFIYGGYGYFDNMNYFFENNGYQVVDRTSLPDADVDYENIWGVADENLFTLAMREIDHTDKEHKPIFAHIMTTSNHRPYTYPEGRIDIPSHTNRNGAVKYTDYAIGKFIRDAHTKPWFSNTVFVIVADHCASSAGKTDLPVDKYHIPMMIYSPANIPPAHMDRLMSQIDIAPTLLGLLNFSYTSKFFGYDMFKLEPGRERAFISTYQKLGFIKDNKLVILSPQQQSKVLALDGKASSDASSNEEVLQEAIAWYQSASYAFRNGMMSADTNEKILVDYTKK